MKRVEDSPYAVQALALLQQGQRLHKHNLVIALGCDHNTARRVIKLLREHKLVHVVDWTRNGERGGLTAVIVNGPGEDVPKPTTKYAAQACRRYRERHGQLKNPAKPYRTQVDPLTSILYGRPHVTEA